jgi:hypothetical protein
MDQTKLNIMQLRARALAMAIRGHFRAASEGDAEVLEALASHCVRDLALAGLPHRRKRVKPESYPFDSHSALEPVD